MAKSDYMPKRDNDLGPWTQNLEGKIPNYATTFGLLPADITAIEGNCTVIRNVINDNNAAQQTARNVRQNKDATISANLKSLRSLIKQWKASNGYTSAIGEDLDIIGTEQEYADADFTPVLTARVTAGNVELSFKKTGGIEGVNIYTRIEGHADWTKLAFDGHSPYVDNRQIAGGVAENREYMCFGVKDDQQIGQQSNIVTVVFGG